MDKQLIQKYAEVIVKNGINIQKNQILIISSPIEGAEFARMVAESAYKAGAREVVMRWNDELSTKLKYLYAGDEVFDEFPSYLKEFYLSYSEKKAAFLTIYASDPEIMKDVDPERMIRQQKSANKAIREFYDKQMANVIPWCLVSIPTESWAKKVFPNKSSEEAVELLWEAILKANRIYEDNPVKAWEDHKNNLKKSIEFLNSHNFKKIKISNQLGTNLEIELPENHVWLGGSDFTPENIEFIANMPTEEVFTAPKKDGVNGIVYSSKPLNFNGKLIDKFSLTFKEGKIVDFTAEEGYDTLKRLIETDEGSHYLGEVALVPYDSPISQANIIFYNTLYDENASCHLAIGKGYPNSIKNGENMSIEELTKAGINNSIVHEDFMFGTKDLNIIGITQDDKEIPIFKDGNFS